MATPATSHWKPSHTPRNECRFLCLGILDSASHSLKRSEVMSLPENVLTTICLVVPLSSMRPRSVALSFLSVKGVHGPMSVLASMRDVKSEEAVCSQLARAVAASSSNWEWPRRTSAMRARAEPPSDARRYHLLASISSWGPLGHARKARRGCTWRSGLRGWQLPRTSEQPL